jgi:hypothetical protein
MGDIYGRWCKLTFYKLGYVVAALINRVHSKTMEMICNEFLRKIFLSSKDAEDNFSTNFLKGSVHKFKNY